MMYAEPVNFEKDFIKRTKNILNSYQGECNVTLFINCMLGLLVIPKEKRKNLIDNDMISKKLFNEVFNCCKNNKKQATDLSIIISRLRNAVSHGHMVFEAEKQPDGKVGTEIARVVFFDDTRCGDSNNHDSITPRNAEFTCTIEYNLLRKFVLEFADALEQRL